MPSKTVNAWASLKPRGRPAGCLNQALLHCNPQLAVAHGGFLPVAASYPRRRSGEMTSIIGPPSALTTQELANSRKEYNFSVIISCYSREEITRIAGVLILFMNSPEHQLTHRVAVFARCRPGFPRSVCCQVPFSSATSLIGIIS